jgi:hypothetical protein
MNVNAYNIYIYIYTLSLHFIERTLNVKYILCIYNMIPIRPNHYICYVYIYTIYIYIYISTTRYEPSKYAWARMKE